MTVPVNEAALPLPLLRRGKVRDVYQVDADRVLLVASDRASAFDVVMRQPVPRKGEVLTQLTAWWLGNVRGVPHHMITADTDEIVASVPAIAPMRDAIAGRSMLAWSAAVFPVECVVRGYLSGSGWKEYRATGSLAGEALPVGLRESEALPEPRFTPATKAEAGHDENISRAAARGRLGAAVADRLEELSLGLYHFGSEVADDAGLILADTKFEFGERNGEVILVDEVMTPDSSRFWARDSYRPGSTPPSFDKQPLRDYLELLRSKGEWNGEAPAPVLPGEVLAQMSQRYLDAFRRLTGKSLPLSQSAPAAGTHTA
ncbi:MAG: phosphoribosylaminoimidazolesuccinocarboxamide synthase [Gemmatimonadaceae bacterium]